MTVFPGLGIKKLVDRDSAELNRLSDRRGFVSGASQQTWLEVNEHGTRAAAVTAVTPGASSTAEPVPLLFHADHPFLFLIRDRQTHLVLFIGRVVFPES